MNKKHTSQSPRILQVRKDRNYDCVYVKGKKIMLGKSGSPEAGVGSTQKQGNFNTFFDFPCYFPCDATKKP